jgi:hypothetical protein
VTIGFQHQLQRVSIVLIVINDKDTGEICCHQHLELFSIGDASLSVRENAPQRCDQPIEFDRLGVELVAPRRERLFAFTGERVR